jgi:DNA-binding GntR family transcriptional regulator
MSTATPRRTRAEELRIALADDIMSGRLVPGFRLDERQLAAAGLAETRPHKGAVVAPVTEARLHDMFEVMAELEGVCSRLAAERMSPRERRELEALRVARVLEQSGVAAAPMAP